MIDSARLQTGGVRESLMLKSLAKRMAAWSSPRFQRELKRLHFRRQIRRGDFVPDEAEMPVIRELVKPGDCVIDVGANVGHYTLHLSACVGATGRVISFEPLLDAFALLTANVQAAGLANVTLVNAAASHQISVAHMSVPKFEGSGLDNLYRAHLDNTGELSVLCLPLDLFPLQAAVKLIKIDAEGHDLQVLKGAERLLAAHRPVLVVECAEQGEIATWLRERGYQVSKVNPASPNIVARPG